MRRSRSLAINEVHHGDCLELTRDMPENSIDFICTDPPYELSSITKHRTDKIAIEGNDGKGNPYCRQQAKKGFMGKEWDVIPPQEHFNEFYRVLKHGAFACFMCSPRLDCLTKMGNRLEQAGFITTFTTISWVYASGFPKAKNISKAVDKKFGWKRDMIKTTGNLHKNDISHGWKESNESLQMSDVPKSRKAKALDGSYAGYQPKPAQEFILCVMKPLSEKNYTEQALKDGKGVSWLGNGKIPVRGKISGAKIERSAKTKGIYGKFADNAGKETWNPKDNSGRFSPNLLCQDDVLNDGSIHKTHATGINRNGKMSPNSWFLKGKPEQSHGSDSGSFSRFFDLDAWFEERLKLLPESVQRTFPNLIVAKPSPAEKNKGCEGLDSKSSRSSMIIPRGFCKNCDAVYEKCNCGNLEIDYKLNDKKEGKNTHVSVKPIKLLSYLITIFSREGNIVLDPFMGSGTTLIAAYMLRRKYIGIEKDAESFQIAEERIDDATRQMRLF